MSKNIEIEISQMIEKYFGKVQDKYVLKSVLSEELINERFRLNLDIYNKTNEEEENVKIEFIKIEGVIKITKLFINNHLVIDKNLINIYENIIRKCIIYSYIGNKLNNFSIITLFIICVLFWIMFILYIFN